MGRFGIDPYALPQSRTWHYKRAEDIRSVAAVQHLLQQNKNRWFYCILLQTCERRQSVYDGRPAKCSSVEVVAVSLTRSRRCLMSCWSCRNSTHSVTSCWQGLAVNDWKCHVPRIHRHHHVPSLLQHKRQQRYQSMH